MSVPFDAGKGGMSPDLGELENILNAVDKKHGVYGARGTRQTDSLLRTRRSTTASRVQRRAASK